MKTSKGWVVASELSDQLKDDPDYQARIRQRDDDVDEAIARARVEEKPILDALRDIGIDIETIWSQNFSSKLSKEAVDILVKHLTLPYSEGTREGLARALGNPLSRRYWPLLVSEYRKSKTVPNKKNVRNGYNEGLACTIAKLVTSDTLDEYIDLVRDESNGSSRILLISALRRSRDPRAKKALEGLIDDPDLRKEITAWKRQQEKKNLR